jgi:hypothetical protein
VHLVIKVYSPELAFLCWIHPRSLRTAECSGKFTAVRESSQRPAVSIADIILGKV